MATDIRDCAICAMEAAEPAVRIFADELWAAEVPLGLEVPGWYFLRTRRHAELLTGLDESEAASFGAVAQTLVAAVERATDAPAVYLMTFGENHRHFHVLITARGEEVPQEERGGAIVTTAKNHVDRPAALAVAEKVRSAYDAIVADRV